MTAIRAAAWRRFGLHLDAIPHPLTSYIDWLELRLFAEIQRVAGVAVAGGMTEPVNRHVDLSQDRQNLGSTWSATVAPGDEHGIRVLDDLRNATLVLGANRISNLAQLARVRGSVGIRIQHNERAEAHVLCAKDDAPYGRIVAVAGSRARIQHDGDQDRAVAPFLAKHVPVVAAVREASVPNHTR